MEVSGNNNTVYCSYTTSITTNNEHSFNNSSRNVQTGGCLFALLIPVVLLIVVPWLACTGMLDEVFSLFF